MVLGVKTETSLKGQKMEKLQKYDYLNNILIKDG